MGFMDNWDYDMMLDKNLTIEKDLDIFDGATAKLMLNKLQKDINIAIEFGIADSVSKIIKKLESLLDGYGVPGLKSEISSSIGFKSFEIAVNGDVALFVEFGTGIVGSRNPHPVDPWQYDVNDHGDKGWRYKDSSGQWRATSGMKSRPYFNDLLQWVKSYGIIARSINRRLRAIK
jgi:hypothetical protein